MGLYLEVYNRPGALSEILTALKRRNVNVLTVVFGSPVELGEVGSLFMALDLTGAGVGPEEVREELGGLDNVASVEVAHPQLPQVLADTYHFPILDYSGSRYIMFSETIMRGLIVRLKEKFGSGGQAFLYHQGMLAGEALAESYSAIGIKGLHDALRMLLLHGTTSGRYRGEIVEFAYSGVVGGVVLRLYNNWECEMARRHGLEGPASHFERGIMAGLVYSYTKRSVVVSEVECIASGDPYCEFKIEIG